MDILIVILYLIIAGIATRICEKKWTTPLNEGPEPFFGGLFWPFIVPIWIGMWIFDKFN